MFLVCCDWLLTVHLSLEYRAWTVTLKYGDQTIVFFNLTLYFDKRDPCILPWLFTGLVYIHNSLQ